MRQLSRPYQIALGAIALLAVVWVVALRGHKSSGGEERAASSTPQASTPAARPSQPTAPGVAGLTRAIEKAHGAVAQSERNAKQLEQKSAEASGSTASTQPTHAAPGRSTSTTPSRSRSAAKPHTTTRAPHSAHSALAGQTLVEELLNRNKTVALLFWNPASAEDRFVLAQLGLLRLAQKGVFPVSLGRLPESVSRELGDGTVVQEPPRLSEEDLVLLPAPANQVASFGTVTRVVQVYETPTLLIVGPKHRQVKPLTGYRTAFAIEQALDEAANA